MTEQHGDPKAVPHSHPHIATPGPLTSQHHADEHDNPVAHAAAEVADGAGDALVMFGQAVSGPPIHEEWEDKVAEYDRTHPDQK